MPFRSRLTRWAGAALLALFVAVVVAGCGGGTEGDFTQRPPSILDPKGPVADREAGFFWFILVVATIVFVAVIAVLLYSVFRFRARPGGPEARQIHGNTRIEIAWTVLPALVLFAVLVATISTMVSLAEPSGGSNTTITVDAIGHQWWWEFRYPNDGNVVTADELHVPVNRRVHVNLISDNVIHSFWIPQLAGKTDVIPGHNNTMWFQADEAGQYRGECAEFCGLQHARMNFLVVAETQGDYQAWLSGQQRAASAQVSDATAAAGQKIFTQKCASCHHISGVTKADKAQIGPDLTHFATRQLIAGGVLTNTPENLHTWVNDAQAVKEGCDMPAFNTLKPQDLDSLISYLQTLQ